MAVPASRAARLGIVVVLVLALAITACTSSACSAGTCPIPRTRQLRPADAAQRVRTEDRITPGTRIPAGDNYTMGRIASKITFASYFRASTSTG